MDDELIPVIFELRVEEWRSDDPRLRVGDNVRVTAIYNGCIEVIRLGNTPVAVVDVA